MSEFTTPTEKVELPSRGLVYPEDNILSKGVLEMKYMTAKEEDILSNQSFIKNGTVLDKLLESLIVEKININDLIVGDRNALLIAARILGFGPEYVFNYKGDEVEINLSELDNKVFDESLLLAPHTNEFKFSLPTTDNMITFKLLTGNDDKKIDAEIKALKRLNKNISPEVTTTLKYMITSVNGSSDTKEIREFVDKGLMARDSRALRKYITEIQPAVNMSYILDSGEEVEVPIGLGFFWPEL